jgi:hypothetical protein
MFIEEAFTAYLLAHPGLKALINDRFYPDELPQGTVLPAVSYIKISDVKDHTLTGQSKLENPIFQFTTFAYTKKVTKEVAEQLKAALSDYQGIMSGVEVQHIKLENEMSNLEKSSDGTIKVYTEDLEYQIYYVKE